MDFDCVVVGLGCVGISCLRHISKNNSVLGIEKDSIVNPNATSYGQSRLFRLAYESEEYIPLLRRSLEDWKNLDETIDSSLFYNVGTAKFSHTEGYRVAESKNSCDKLDVCYKEISNNEYKLFNLDTEYSGIYQKDSGVLDAQTCLQSELNIAFENGVNILENTKFRNWTKREDGVIVVETNSGTFTTSSLVISTGAWASNHLNKVSDYLNPVKHTYTHFLKSKTSEIENIGFSVETKPEDPNMYGLVEPKINAIKLGVYTEWDTVEKEEVSNFERAHRRNKSSELAYARDFFNFPINTYVSNSCLITETPDNDPIIDTIDENIVVAVGMSGHGFKYSNVIGELIKEKVVDEFNFDCNTPNFTLERF